MPLRHHSRRFAFALLLTLILHGPAADLFRSGQTGRALGALSPESPEVKAAVARGIEFLKTHGAGGGEGHRSFAAATVMKAGVPPEDPFVKAEMDRLLKKFEGNGYRVSANNNALHNNYEPAADLMALCIARRYEVERNNKPDAYSYQIQEVIDFLVSKQNPGGDWDYFGRGSDQGDTSQTQFVLLGLWSATDEGFTVPQEVWENAATWLVTTQFENGGFSYHPRGPKDHGIEHGTTVAGVTGLLIAALHLYSPDEIGKAKATTEPKVKESPFEAGEAAAPDAADGKPLVNRPKEAKKPSISQSELTAAIGRGRAWLEGDYRMEKVQRFDLYYRYGVERMTAMLDMKVMGGHDWYEEGATLFLKEQGQDGAWSTLQDGMQAGTCFGILFLTRATWTRIKHTPIPGLGKGQMRADRGNLDLDPSKMTQTAEGELVRTVPTGPLEEFLKDLLENPASKAAPDLGKKIVIEYKGEKRKELIGQKDKLVQLLELPNDDARIAALWALGRCEDLGLAPLMIKALGDNNVDVAVEARNALCVLSRRPLGEGLAAHPWTDLPEDAAPEVKQKAFVEWRSAVLERWKQWYARVRPYDQRDDLSDLGMN